MPFPRCAIYLPFVFHPPDNLIEVSGTSIACPYEL